MPVVTRGLGQPANNLTTYGLGIKVTEPILEFPFALLLGVATLHAKAADRNTIEMPAFATLQAASRSAETSAANLFAEALLEANGTVGARGVIEMLAVATIFAEGSTPDGGTEGRAVLLATAVLEAMGRTSPKADAELSAFSYLNATGRSSQAAASYLEAIALMEVVGRTATISQATLNGLASVLANPGLSSAASLEAFALSFADGRAGKSAATELIAVAQLFGAGTAGSQASANLFGYADLLGTPSDINVLNMLGTADVIGLGRSSESASATLSANATFVMFLAELVRGFAELEAIATIFATGRTASPSQVEILGNAFLSSRGRTASPSFAELLAFAEMAATGRTASPSEIVIPGFANVLAISHRDIADLLGQAEMIFGSLELPGNPAELLATALLNARLRNIIPIVDLKRITAKTQITKLVGPSSEVVHKSKGTTYEIKRRRPSTQVSDPD